MPTYSALYQKKINTEYENIKKYVLGQFELAEAKALKKTKEEELKKLDAEIEALKAKKLSKDYGTELATKNSLITAEDAKLKAKDAQISVIEKKPRINATDKFHLEQLNSEKAKIEAMIKTWNEEKKTLEEEKAKEEKELAESKKELKEKNKKKEEVEKEIEDLKKNKALKAAGIKFADEDEDEEDENEDDDETQTKKTEKILEILKKEQDDINALKADEDRKATLKTIQDGTLAKLKAECGLKETDELYKQVVDLHKSRMKPFTDVRRSIGLKRLHELDAEKNRRKQPATNNILGGKAESRTGETERVLFTEEELQKAGDRLVYKKNPDIEYTPNGSDHNLTILSNNIYTLQEAVSLCTAQGCNTLDLSPSENSCSVVARHELAKEALRQDYYHVQLRAEGNDKEGRMLQHIFDIKKALAQRNHEKVGLSQDTDWAELYFILGTTSINYRGTFDEKTATGFELQEMLLKNLTSEQLASLTMGLKQKNLKGKGGYTDDFYKDAINEIVTMLMKKSVREQNQYLLDLKDDPELQTLLLKKLAIAHQFKLENLSPNKEAVVSADGSVNQADTQHLQWTRRAKYIKVEEVMRGLVSSIDPRIVAEVRDNGVVINTRNNAIEKLLRKDANTYTHKALTELTSDIGPAGGDRFAPIRSG